MTREQIISRMDELGERANSRVDEAPHLSNMQYAAILWMTEEEAKEFLELRLSLPTARQEREEAKLRIQQKIKQRKTKKIVDSMSE